MLKPRLRLLLEVAKVMHTLLLKRLLQPKLLPLRRLLKQRLLLLLPAKVLLK
jgi:hypothetical protein